MIENEGATSQLGGPPVSYDPELERIERKAVKGLLALAAVTHEAGLAEQF